MEPVKVTDEELLKFMELNEFDGRDKETIMDVLTVSKVYDRNFKRMTQETNKERLEMHRLVEKHLNDANNFLRGLSVIRCVGVINNEYRKSVGREENI